MLTRIRDAPSDLWHSPTFLCYWADRPSSLNVAFALICLAFSAIVFTVYHPPSQYILRDYIALAVLDSPADEVVALCDEIDLKDTSTVLANFTSSSWNCFLLCVIRNYNRYGLPSVRRRFGIKTRSVRNANVSMLICSKDYIGSIKLNVSLFEGPGGAQGLPFDFLWAVGSPSVGADPRCGVCSAMEDVFLNVSSNNRTVLTEYTLELSQGTPARE